MPNKLNVSYTVISWEAFVYKLEEFRFPSSVIDGNSPESYKEAVSSYKSLISGNDSIVVSLCGGRNWCHFAFNIRIQAWLELWLT